jgi:hypothetical protein
MKAKKLSINMKGNKLCTMTHKKIFLMTDIKENAQLMVTRTNKDSPSCKSYRTNHSISAQPEHLGENNLAFKKLHPVETADRISKHPDKCRQPDGKTPDLQHLTIILKLWHLKLFVPPFSTLLKQSPAALRQCLMML